MSSIRRLLFATSILSGLWLVGPGPVAAGPNTPSMSAPSIAPMRPEFNMRGPDALRRGDTASPRDAASIPRDPASKKSGKPKDKSKAAASKKGRDAASRGKAIGGGVGVSGVGAVSNPMPSSGGRDAEPLSEARRASLERMRNFLRGLDKQDNLRQLRELLDGLLGGGGPLAEVHAGAAAGALPGGGGRQAPDLKGARDRLGARTLEQQDGSEGRSGGHFAGLPGAPSYGGRGSHSGPTLKFGWPGNAPEPGGVSDPSGQASTGGPSRNVEGGFVVRAWKERNNAGGTTYREFGHDVNGNEYSYQIDTDAEGNRTDTIIVEWNDGTSEGHSLTRDRNGNVVHRADEPDSQPTEEGTGRPSGGGYRAVTAWRGGRNIVCDFFGCRDLGTTRGRIGDPPKPGTEGASAADAQSSGPRTGPGAATDPCPDCGPSGGGGGTSVSRPSDVGWGGPGVPDGEGVGSGGSPGPRGGAGVSITPR